ncbi:MAG TPA: hypothetical protein VHV74_24875 [Pseudonocardiaceae bacterium]|nr:hypothetical protein [Pseudonocardiaceae bacterium]
MLLVVLLLVLVAFASLVTSLVTGAMLWAWLSVAVSVLAAIVLVVDWARRRNARAEAPRAAPPPAADEASRSVATAEPPVAATAASDAEPAEEDTDAADLLVVTDLDTEVRVLDERPRYHLADCSWLAGRGTLPLPVREARELGFTPCAVCSPDRILAAAARTRG